jgi:hypothetical protein
MKLLKKDYITILNFYNIDHSSMNAKQIQNKAESILATKLCKCIKKVDPTLKDEGRAIAVCTDAILSNRNLKISGFECKKRAKLVSRKNVLPKLSKTKRVLSIKNKRN